MGRIVVTCHSTVDGVIQPVGPWFVAEGEHQEVTLGLFREAEALLLGRVTYQGLAQHWPAQTEDTVWAPVVNPMTKHVVSSTLSGELPWNATAHGYDGVAGLREAVEGTLLLVGCGRLARDLAADGLLDEVNLFVHPHVQGSGDRLFHDDEVTLQLLDATPFASGVVRLRYVPA
jgi:dihydrofolate reductase